MPSTSFKTMDFPTSLLPHCRKMEKAIDSRTSNLKEEAKLQLILELVEDLKCTVEQAQEMIEQPEYEDMILEKMIELKEKS